MSERELKLLIDHRRTLHRIPEIDKELYKTNAYVTGVLNELGCELTTVVKTGVCAWFDRNQKSTVAFRCDMDGLPINEANVFDHASTFPGRMHACGHDGHMALLLTFAQYVDRQKDLPYNVLLIFQPAEETNGGAESVVASNILEKYNATHIFGLHIWPDLKKGTIASRPGVMMAQSEEITFNILGKGAHATMPQKAIDALYIGCRYVAALYEMQEKEIPKSRRTILKIGSFTSGSVRNTISEKTSCLGTMRAFDPEDIAFMKRRVAEIAKKYEKEFGCRFEFIDKKAFLAVVNDASLFSKILPALKGFQFEELQDATLASEDFSFYGRRIPSVFFFLGTGESIALHSNNFDFDESILLTGLELYKKLLTC